MSVNKTICWLITNKCNRSCSFCISKSSPSYKIQKYQNQIKIIEQLKNLNVNKISISGGEPFIVKHLKDIVQLIHKVGLNCQITTNSDVFIKKGVPIWVFEYETQIILSLYGGENEHNRAMGENHFEKVLELANKFQRTQVSLNIIETEDSVSFLKKNFKTLEKKFSRILLIKKINCSKKLRPNNYESLKQHFEQNNKKLKFQFLYHNYDKNEFFPVISDIGDITFTSNNETKNIGSIFSSHINFNEETFKTVDFFKMIWNQQYINKQMIMKTYG